MAYIPDEDLPRHELRARHRIYKRPLEGVRVDKYSYIVPLLRHYADGEQHDRRVVIYRLGNELGYSVDHVMDQLNEIIGKGETYYTWEAKGAHSTMVQHGFLSRIDKETFSITDAGRVLLAGHEHDTIDDSFVERSELGAKRFDGWGNPLEQPKKSLVSRLFGKK